MSEYARRCLAVIDFRHIMKEKLELNVHKGDWRNMSTAELLLLLRDEVDELQQALVDLEAGNGTPRDVQLECADVANFSMFISDVVSEP